MHLNIVAYNIYLNVNIDEDEQRVIRCCDVWIIFQVKGSVKCMSFVCLFV